MLIYLFVDTVVVVNYIPIYFIIDNVVIIRCKIVYIT